MITNKRGAYTLDVVGERWMLSLHMIFALAWLAAVVVQNLLLFVSSASSADGLLAAHRLLLRVDEFFRVPAMAGVLVTTFLIVRLADGVFRQRRWYSRSWAVKLGLAALNTVFLGPWIIRMLTLVETQGYTALADPAYQSYRTLLIALNAAQILVLLLVIVVRPRIGVLYSRAAPWRLSLGQFRGKSRLHTKHTGRMTALGVPHLS